MPASVTTTTRAPVLEQPYQLVGAPRLVALEVGHDPRARLRLSSRSSSRRNRRVSSAAITSAPAELGDAAAARRRRRRRSGSPRAPRRRRAHLGCHITPHPRATSYVVGFASRRSRRSGPGHHRVAPTASTYDGRVTRQVLEPADRDWLVRPTPTLERRRCRARCWTGRLRPPSTIERLRVAMPTDRINGWVVTLDHRRIAFVIRFVNLGYPNKLVFDETYYAKDAYSLLKFGYERDWPSDANAKIIAGNVDVMNDTASFIVHPPLGKWLIAAGEQLFGMNSFGWRFASLVFGTLLIMVTIRLVRRVSRSTLIGGLAGLLLTFDGLAFVMSRTALLDIFLAFFVVAAVACLVADRDWFRNRLADHLERREIADLGGRFGPALVLRPWRIAAGISFGLALGTKWNALYLLAAFALLCAGLGRRRPAAGRRRIARQAGHPARRHSGLRLAGRARLVVYVGTWAGWLATIRRLRPPLGRRAPGGSHRAAARAAARVVACTTSTTSGTSTPATSSTRPSTPTAPTRPAG